MYVCMYVCVYIYIYIYIYLPRLLERPPGPLGLPRDAPLDDLAIGEERWSTNS